MTRIECLVYAAVHRRMTASVDEVCDDLSIDAAEAFYTLEKFVKRGWLHRLGDFYRAWVLRPRSSGLGRAERALSKERANVAPDSKSQMIRSPSDLISDHRSAARARDEVKAKPAAQRTLQVCRSALLKADETAGDKHDQRALAGRFIRRWEELYGVEYKPPISYSKDVWFAEQILSAEPTLAVWIVEAMFDKQLGWLTSKSLEFAANQQHRNRHLRQVAVQLVGRYQAPRADGQPVQAEVNIPGGKL